jgi:dTDP-glucose 4,6-dehydratase/UDP-glucuronate decarboxylase
VKIVRPFNVYGPGQRLDDGRVLPDFVRDSLHGRPITVYSDGRATRSFCYIRDFITGAMSVWLSSADGEAFNVGNDEEVTVAELAERVAIAAGPPRVPVQPRTHSDRDYVTDNPQRRCPDLRKVRQWTDWRPAVMLDEGLARTLASYREVLAAGLPTQEQGS